MEYLKGIFYDDDADGGVTTFFPPTPRMTLKWSKLKIVTVQKKIKANTKAISVNKQRCSYKAPIKTLISPLSMCLYSLESAHLFCLCQLRKHFI